MFTSHKKFRMFLIVFIALVCIFSTLKIGKTSGQGEVKQDLVVKELSNVLKEWYCGVRSTDFKNISVNASLADDIQPVKIGGGKAEAVFYVKATMIPKVTLEEVSHSPFLKGMERYLNENRKKLTAAQTKTVEQVIRKRYDALKYIVGKPHEENGTFKVVGSLTSKGTINKNSIEIFYDVSAKGEPVWEDVNKSFVPSTSPSYKEEEERGYNEIKDLIERLYPSNSSGKQVSPNSYYYDYYDGTGAALHYADPYTSEASYDKEITCWIGNEPVVSHYTDISYWNNSQYPLTKYSNGYYEPLACNNCADFVSQAMYYGGMLPDANWNPQNRKTSVGGKWYWANVGDLTDWMKERGDWSQISYNDLTFGDVAVFYYINNYGEKVRYHIAMDDYPLGYYGLNYFAAHTNDVKVHYYNSSSKLFYRVSCLRETP